MNWLYGWRKRLGNLFRDILAVWMGLRDPRVPWYAKITGLAAILYLVSPVDLIPDVIPVIGWLDDFAMLPLAGYVASQLIPFQLMKDLRERADAKLMRWGPKAAYVALAVVALWIALAVLAGFFLWRSWRTPDTRPSPAPPAVMPASANAR